MTPPTGRLIPTPDGYDLILTRTVRAPLDDVWASITEPERTARWFGPWEGAAGPGRTVRIQMVHEEGSPWFDLRIEACRPPSHLAVSMTDDAGDWHLEVHLVHVDDTTEIRLVQHRDSAEGLGEIGPGWEYYLDMLLAARDGSSLPMFDDYYPTQKEYFERLAEQ